MRARIGWYSRVPNKRGVRIIEGLEMVRYTEISGFDIAMIGGVRIIRGGGCLEKLKIVVFLGKHVSCIYLCEQ